MSDSRTPGGRAARGALGRARLLGAGLVPLAYFAASFACSKGERPRETGADAPDLHHGPLDAGVDPNENLDGNDAGADPAGDAGAPVGDGGATDPEPPACGNGRIDPEEECDPGLASIESCVLRGFDTGVLGCDATCHFVSSDCSGVESCYDGRDNDGDGALDCGDADCAVPCTDACFSPPVLAANTTLYGTTLGHGSTLAASCSDAAPSGREVAYQVNISADGKLDVVLSSDQALSVSLRSSCEDVGTELSCGSQTRLTRSVYAGETYFVFVDGASSEDAGDYVLDVQMRQQACGDAIRDAGEECDDGNINDGDGCDPDCNLEASESEPNDGLAQANSYDSPWFAQIGAEGDEDYYSVTLDQTSSTLVVSTQNLGDGACAYNLMDTAVEIFDTDARGNVLRATDDDGGDGKCSLAIAPGLLAGTYFVRVKAADGASPDNFPYRLDIDVAVCGDGLLSFGEECDDHNLSLGDGCDFRCRLEVSP
jgi:cysteine-rich repeat protein